jgi:hypothetical protein
VIAHRTLTDIEAKAQGLIADRIARDNDGRLTFYCDDPPRVWDRREDLADNPPLASWAGGIPPAVIWP